MDKHRVNGQKANDKHRTDNNLAPAPDVAKKMQPVTKPDFDSLLRKAASQPSAKPEPKRH